MDGGHATATGPLAGLVVIEAADSPAAGFAAALAGDLGATVIVCEPPGVGAALRRLGTAAVREVWWPILARNKRSLAFDTDHPDAAPVLHRLLARVDLLIRDNSERAASMAAFLGKPPRALDLLLHPPGADRPDLWPWSAAPEFAAAATGVMALTGEAGGPAVQPEMPLADYTAGMLALAHGLAELRASRHEGRAPRPVAHGLHEALMRMNEWQLVVAATSGRAERRIGNRFPMNSNIANVFHTRDGRLLTVSAATPSVAERLLEMIGGSTLLADPRFASPDSRRDNMDALDAIIAAWIGSRDAEEAMAFARARDVVIGPIDDAADLLADPHAASRGDIIRLPDRAGIAMPASLPFMQPAGQVHHLGPAPGANTASILAWLGYTDSEVARLHRCGAVWSPPTNDEHQHGREENDATSR